MYLEKMVSGLSLTDLLSNSTYNSIQLTPPVKEIIIEAAKNMRGSAQRMFMAKTVIMLGKGWQRKAEKEFGWNRKTIRKGLHEVESGIICLDNFSGRGRLRIEVDNPKLLNDIKDIAEPTSQADPTFRTTRIYTPLTAESVRKALIDEKGYSDSEIPCVRTICTKLNELNYHPQKVAKTKPIKKIKETDAIFEQVHKTNKLADTTEGVLRLSIDTKARIKIGPFSRGGKSRRGTKGADHDFDPKEKMTSFGIFLPFYGETFLYFSDNSVTADFMIDALESLWKELKERFSIHTLVINWTMDLKITVVDFSYAESLNVKLAYYPPYHSKYNPVERVWGVLENHWNSEILDSKEKVLGLAKTMKWNQRHPTVKFCYGAVPTA